MDFKKEDVDVLALGCSHFPFLKKQMAEILGKNVEILDSGAAIARQTKRVLEKESLLSEERNAKNEFYTTGDTGTFSAILKTIGYNDSVEKVHL